MSPYTRFVSSALFPLHEKLKRHDSVARRKELERTQWLYTDALQALQIDRLQHFLVHIGRHVPYYRDSFRAQGFDPAAVKRYGLKLFGTGKIWRVVD